MVEFVERSFSNAQDFLDALRLSHREWNTYHEHLDRRGLPDNQWRREWIFRGHGSKLWTLTPAAWRDDPTEKLSPLFLIRNLLKEHPTYMFPTAKHVDNYTYVERNTLLPPSQPDLELRQERIKTLLLHACAEIDLMYEFLELSDELGFSVGALPEWTGSRENFIDQYVQMYIPDIHNVGGVTHKVNALWTHPSIALAQHHRIPTRLLDWTRSPLIAAFFAAISVPDAHQPDDELVVFAINEEMLQRDIRKVIVPAHENDYLRMQMGVFTYDTTGEQYFLSSGHYPSLEETIQSQPESLKVYYPKKYSLSVTEAPELLRLLWLERMTQAHLMPTLDNVAHTVITRIRLATE